MKPIFFTVFGGFLKRCRFVISVAIVISCLPLTVSGQAVQVPVEGVFPWETTQFSYDGVTYEVNITSGGAGELGATVAVAGELSGHVCVAESFVFTTYNPLYSEEYNPDASLTTTITVPVTGYNGDMASNTELVSIALPKYFGSYGFTLSFEGCAKLESASFWINRYGASVPSFRNCASLRDVTITGVNTASVLDAFGFSAGESDDCAWDGHYNGGDFSGCTSLESVSYADGQIEMGDYTGCSSLRGVTFGDGVEALDMSKFFRCPSLQTIELPKSVKAVNFPTVWDDMAGSVDPFVYNTSFDGFSFTRYPYIDDNGEVAYRTNPYIRQENGALSVATLNAADEITGWDIVKFFPRAGYTVSKCEPYGSATEYYYEVPDYVTSIANFAFQNVPFMNLWIGDSVKTVGREVFSQKYGERGTVIIGKNVDRIDANAFAASKLIFTGITPPQPSGYNQTSVFNGGSSINYVHPDAVEAYRGTDPTGNCDIRPIEFVTDLKYDYRLDHEARTASVEKITGMSGDKPVEFKETVGFFNRSYTVNSVTGIIEGSTVTLHKNIESFDIPFESTVADYVVADENHRFRAFDGVLYRVGDGTYDCPESLHFWPSLKEGECVVREGTRVARLVNCPGMTSLTVPESLDSIYTADEYLPALNQIIIPSAAKWMTIKGGNPVDRCGGYFVSPVEYICGGMPLTSVEVPADLSLRPGVFYGASHLESVTFEEPAENTGIGDYAFANCRALRSVKFSDGIVSIGNNAFSQCVRIENVKLPHSLKSLGREVFYGDSSLTVLSLSPALTLLPEGLVSGCCNLQTLIVPEGVRGLARNVMAGKYPRLSLISLPSTLESLGLEIYYGLPSIAKNLENTQLYSWSRNPANATNEDFLGLTLHVPAGTADDYASASGWKTAERIVDDLIMESEPTAESNRIIIALPTDCGDASLAIDRFVVDLYRLGETGTTEFIDSYCFDAKGQAIVPTSTEGTQRTAVIEGLEEATSYRYELRGYTGNDDLVVLRTADIATGTSSLTDPSADIDRIALRAGNLYLPARFVGMELSFFTPEGRQASKVIFNGIPVFLRDFLAPGIYIYRIGSESGKIRID